MDEWSLAITSVLHAMEIQTTSHLGRPNNNNVSMTLLSRPLSQDSPKIRMMTPRVCFERTAAARAEATVMVLEATVVKGQERSRCLPTARIGRGSGDRSFSANHWREGGTIGLRVLRAKRCLSSGGNQDISGCSRRDIAYITEAAIRKR